MELSPRTVENLRIVEAGFKPGKCPACGDICLWPQPQVAMNSVSRKDNKTYICNPCGNNEALDDYHRPS